MLKPAARRQLVGLTEQGEHRLTMLAGLDLDVSPPRHPASASEHLADRLLGRVVARQTVPPHTSRAPQPVPLGGGEQPVQHGFSPALDHAAQARDVDDVHADGDGTVQRFSTRHAFTPPSPRATTTAQSRGCPLPGVPTTKSRSNPGAGISRFAIGGMRAVSSVRSATATSAAVAAPIRCPTVGFTAVTGTALPSAADSASTSAESSRGTADPSANTHPTSPAPRPAWWSAAVTTR